MILASTSWEASRLALTHTSFIRIELKKHVSALTHLSLLIEHEAASESIDLVIEAHWGVTLTPLNSLSARVWDSFPDYLVSIDLGLNDFFACIVVETTHKVHLVIHCSQSGTLSRSWHPFWVKWYFNIDSEAFTFLHTLDVWLKTTYKLINKFVPWNVLCGVNMELFVLFFVAWLIMFVDYSGLGSRNFDSLCDHLALSLVVDIERIAFGSSWTEILACVISKVHRTLPSHEEAFGLSVHSHSMCHRWGIHLGWGGPAWRIHRHEAQGSGRHEVIWLVNVHSLWRVL